MTIIFSISITVYMTSFYSCFLCWWSSLSVCGIWVNLNTLPSSKYIWCYHYSASAMNPWNHSELSLSVFMTDSTLFIDLSNIFKCRIRKLAYLLLLMILELGFWKLRKILLQPILELCLIFLSKRTLRSVCHLDKDSPWSVEKDRVELLFSIWLLVLCRKYKAT